MKEATAVVEMVVRRLFASDKLDDLCASYLNAVKHAVMCKLPGDVSLDNRVHALLAAKGFPLLSLYKLCYEAGKVVCGQGVKAATLTGNGAVWAKKVSKHDAVAFAEIGLPASELLYCAAEFAASVEAVITTPPPTQPLFMRRAVEVELNRVQHVSAALVTCLALTITRACVLHRLKCTTPMQRKMSSRLRKFVAAGCFASSMRIPKRLQRNLSLAA